MERVWTQIPNGGLLETALTGHGKPDRALQRVAAPVDRQRRLEDQTGECADSVAYSAFTRYLISMRVWFGPLLCRRISRFSQGSLGRDSPKAPDVARTPRIRGRPGNVRLGFEA